MYRKLCKCFTARINHYVITTKIRLIPESALFFFSFFCRLTHDVNLHFYRTLFDAKEKEENDDSFLEMTPP